MRRMRPLPGWSLLLVALLLSAQDLGAQSLAPSRFGVVTRIVDATPDVPQPEPRICPASQGRAAARGAAFGALTVGGATFVFYLVRGMLRLAQFRATRERVPILEFAAAGAALGGVIEGIRWERRCG